VECRRHGISGRSRNARAVTLGVGIAASLSAAACARFTPVVATGARSGDVELRLEHVRVGPSRELVFATRSAAPHTLQRGWVTVPTRDPCTGGADVAAIAVDRGAVVGGELPAGSHELSVKVDDHLDDLALDLVVDLQIENDACVRVPVISQSIPLEAQQRTVVIAGLELGGNGDLSGLRASTGFSVGAGHWFGPALLTAQVGGHITVCNEQTCGKDSDGNLQSGWAVPFALDARYAFGTAARNKLVSVGLVGARYSFMPLQLPALDGDRRFAVHGFQAVLAWAFDDKLNARFRHLERAMPGEFAFPIGVFIDQGAPVHRVVFAAGVDFRFYFQL
jgi:hypothetical protein